MASDLGPEPYRRPTEPKSAGCPFAGAGAPSRPSVRDGGLSEGQDAHQKGFLAARDHAIIAAALDPIITISATGIVQSASDSVQRVFGWAPSELIGRNVNVLMPEPHHSAHDGYLANYGRTGQTHIMGITREFEGIRKNGERFPIELSVSRVDTSAGEAPLFVGLIRDISDRKRLERELRLLKDIALAMSNARTVAEARAEALRLICEATAWDHGEVWAPAEDNELKGVASWTRPGCNLEAFSTSIRDARCKRGVGLAGQAWASGETAWLGDLSIVSLKEFPRCRAAWEAGLTIAAAIPVLVAGEVSKVLLFFACHAQREDLHLLELVRAGVAPLGTLIGRKRTEGQLEDYRRDLEEKVTTRSRELQESQDRLRLSDRLASIGTLAAGLGHDMNNVLLPVRAHLNALQADEAGRRGHPISAARRKHLNEIGKSVAYLQQLADGLHFLAMDPEIGEDERGGGDTTDLRQWWSQTGVLIAKSVPRHVQVTCSIDAGLPRVAVAAHRLTQAVLNLVVNAGEAIPADRVGRVRVWAEASEEPPMVRLGVTDNGRGMSEDVKKRAFEMFFTTKTRGLGTGLGLALVNKVAQVAGGHVDVESRVGKGTTVTMVLKAASSGAKVASPTVLVSVKDGRSAALVRQILQAGGARLADKAESAKVDVLVTEPTEAARRHATAWRKRHPEGCLVLFGKPNSASGSKWGGLRPLIIKETSDFESLRSTLGSALNVL